MSKPEMVPFLDLITPHLELETELVAAFQHALRSATFIGGPTVERFERAFANFCSVDHCIGVGSGTDALRFAIMAAGVSQDDVVITVSNTFIATTEAITQAGAHIAFVDIDERTYNMDPEKLREFLENNCVVDDSGHVVESKSQRRVAAVVPVHLYGQMCDMDAILEIADSYNLIVIEDACQAHGAEYFSQKTGQWHRAGSMGKAAAFSFYPGKNLGACGEAGAVTTTDESIARKIRMIRDHGQAKKYYHDIEGYNGRLDAIQAGLLHAKLNHLENWNEHRRQHASRYRQAFAASEFDLISPYEPSYSNAVYHLYVLRVPGREQFQAHMASGNVGTAIHYPIPLHLQKAYAHHGYRVGDFPVTERVAREIVSLPMFPQLTSHQLDRVIATVLSSVSAKALAAVAQ